MSKNSGTEISIPNCGISTEPKLIRDGDKVALTFRAVKTRSMKDGDEWKEVGKDHYGVTLRGSAAEAAAETLHKGSAIDIKGYHNGVSAYLDDAKQPAATTWVHALSVVEHVFAKSEPAGAEQTI